MKLCNRYLLSTAIVAMASCQALSADLPRKAPAAAPVVVNQPYTGFYIGAIGGAGFAGRQFDFVTLPGTATGDIWPAGFLAGITTGYSVALGSAVVQFEADWQYSFNRQGGQCGFLFKCDVQDSYLFDQGIWIGIPFGAITGVVQSTGRIPPASQWPIPIPGLPTTGWGASIMPKIGGGVAERNIKVVQSDPMGVLGGASSTDQAWLFGWWIGGGIEVPVASGWTVSTEWKYRGFNKSFIPAASLATFGPFTQEFTHLSEQSVVAKVKYAF